MITLRQASQVARTRLTRMRNNLQLRRYALKVDALARPDPAIKPVVIFNASTRLVGTSLNAAFSLLTAWALRISGAPVVHFVCQAGMSRCVLGTDREDFTKPPPCKICISQSRWLYTNAMVIPYLYKEDKQLNTSLQSLSLSQLMEFACPSPAMGNPLKSVDNAPSIPLGRLVLPSVRWVLRRHSLLDDEPTRFLYRQYILSAYRVVDEFSALLDQIDPQVVILFNGMFFPEAAARWVAQQRGVRTVTHEVGLQPACAFFTTGEATAYPLHVPDSFELNPGQNDRLDTYLSQRFHGQFSMAGIKFWPEIKGLDPDFLLRASKFKQLVPVFTNVIFDTSQPHSNVVFPHMFAWLDQVLEIAGHHPETLFVIRAHPDESRPGKASQESVRQWVAQNQAESLPNLTFIDSHQPLSSYELIQRSKFVMVYNSTIGLEASIMGSPVLCAGRARFTQLPTVFFPHTPEDFQQQAESLLEAAEIIVPAQFKRNARRFLYYQLFYSSLPFDEFIEPDLMPGFVHLRNFPLQRLTPEGSSTIKVLQEGILNDKPFLMKDN